MENLTDKCCFFDSPILDQVLPPILILEFIFGLTGNFIALWMFIFYIDSWKPNSVYLTHLAVADIVVLFCLPFRADYYSRGKDWIYGDIPCRLLMFLLASNRAAGIVFLTAVAVDRYFKIVHPSNRVNRMGLNYAFLVCVGLWGLIIAATGYVLASEHLFINHNRTECESFRICVDFSPLSSWHNGFYVIQFFVPAFIVTFCTVCITWQLRNKTRDTDGKIRRACQFVLVVALVFIICFLPSTVSRIAVLVIQMVHDDCLYFKKANVAFYTTVCFTYFNSVLNPIVYYFSSPAFSGHLQNAVNKLLGRKVERGQVASLGVSPYTVSSEMLSVT